MRNWFRKQPPIPEGVKLRMRDGSVVGVECAYKGKVDGFHEWVVTSTLNSEDVAELLIDDFPAKTVITFPARMRHAPFSD